MAPVSDNLTLQTPSVFEDIHYSVDKKYRLKTYSFNYCFKSDIQDLRVNNCPLPSLEWN